MKVVGFAQLFSASGSSVSRESYLRSSFGPETTGAVTNRNRPYSQILRFVDRSTTGRFPQWHQPKSQADGRHCPGNAYQTLLPLLPGKFKFPLVPPPYQVGTLRRNS